MTPRFPKELVKWMREVEQRIMQFDVDIKRLWKRMPQGWRGTDGAIFPAAIPLQSIVPPDQSGSAVTIPPGATGTHDTAGTIPVGSGSGACGPCGQAAWVWTGGNQTWSLFTTNCGAGCTPVEPTTPGAYSGEVRYTCCQESLSGTPASGTHQTGCNCGTVTYQWNTRYWEEVANDCQSPCTTPTPPTGAPEEGESTTRELCCIQTTGTPDTGSSLSGTPASATPLSGTQTADTSLSGSASPQTSVSGSGTPSTGSASPQTSISGSGTPASGSASPATSVNGSGTGFTQATGATQGTGATAASCSQCPSGMPACWRFSVSGVANESCTQCGGYNGAWIVRDVGGCVFQSDAAAGCSVNCGNESVIAWTMSFSGGWILQSGGGSPAEYELTSGNPCAGESLTFTKTMDDFCCSGWPSTITVTPGGC